jgi:hypothetical protein
MALKNIPDNHHYSRICPKNRVIRHEGRAVGVHPQLFKLRDKSETREAETYLSGAYVEYYGTDQSKCLKACVAGTALKVTDKDFMVVLNAGVVRSTGNIHLVTLRVVHDSGNRRNPAYAQLIGTPRDPTHAILAALASSTVSRLVSIPDIKAA